MPGRMKSPFVKRTLLSAVFTTAALSLLWFAQPAFAYDLSNSSFQVSTGTNGDITSLKLTGDNFPTNYVMNATNAPNQNTADHQWLGELMFTYRLNNGAWTKALTNKSADGRTQSQTGNTVNIIYQNSANAEGIRNFRVNESYSLVSDYLLWQIQVTNTSTQTLEIGDFGLPLPFNEFWTGGGNEQIYESRVVTQSFIGNNSSYVTAQRPSGIGPSLLLVPDATTGAGFEYMDNWRIQDHAGSKWAGDQGGWVEGLSVYYIHSNVIKSTGRGYLPNSSLTLAPGASKTYAFKFFKSASEQATKDRLYSEGLIDTTVVPSLVVPTNQTAKFDLRTSKTITSVTAQYPSETTVASLGTTAGDHKLYSLQMNHLGPNNITVNYGSGEKTTLQFYAIEPVDTALQRHATFMVNNQQWNVPGDIRDKAFDDWMMQTNTKRNNFAGYWGWGDDWGYTHAQFLAEKNVQKPVTSEITALDQYLETTIWTNLMAGHHTDYLVPDFLMAAPNTTPTYRGYAYPHIYNTYFSMYKISKLYPGLITYAQPSNTYLLRAYNIMKALYDGPVAYNWNTGLMGEMTTPEIIKALQAEGYTTQANDIIAKMNTKYNNFASTTYPYGSEYNYDNTGEEAVYMLAKMNNNNAIKSKINTKTRAVRGKMPVWYFYSDPVTINGEPWWQFQYTAALAGTAMDDWVRNNSATPEVEQRLTYAAKLANLTAINSGQISSDPADIGAVSWTYQAMKGNNGALGLDGGPLFNGWRGMSGEADLGLFGAIKLLSSDVAVDPIFGLYGYGCEVTESGGNYIVTPKDGVYQRLNLITEKWGMSLERDKYTLATVAKAKTSASFTLSNATPGTAHVTKVSFTGFAPGTYNVTVNNVASGSFTAVSGQTATASLNIGTGASYEVKIQQGTATPVSSIVVNYNMNQSSGTTVTDSSYGLNHAALTGTATWVTGRTGAGNALNLSGTSAYASLPAGVVSQLNDFTISAWVKITANSDWARIFDFGTGTTANMFLAPQIGGGGMRFAITTGGNSTEQQLTATAPLATGAWKHVVVSLSGTTGRLYLDGVQVAVNTSMTLKPSSLGNITQNYIGKSQYGDPNLNGAVDDFIIFNRALSASEITALFGGTMPALSASASLEELDALQPDSGLALPPLDETDGQQPDGEVIPQPDGSSPETGSQEVPVTPEEPVTPEVPVS